MKESSCFDYSNLLQCHTKHNKREATKNHFYICSSHIYNPLWSSKYFHFVATDIPSNNTEAWILKFCFLAVFSLKFNDRNVKMINLWEKFFFLCILQTQWACLDFDFLLLTGTGFSSLSSSGSGHLNPLLPSSTATLQSCSHHEESRPSPNQQIPCHCPQ